MAMIAVDAKITVADASTRDATVEAVTRLQLISRDEPGCLAYCFAADPAVPDRIQAYELWESEEALEAHFQHPNYVEMRMALGKAGLKDVVAKKYRIDAAADVYQMIDGERRATASFDV